MSRARVRNRRTRRWLAVPVAALMIGSLVGVSGAGAQEKFPPVDQPGVSAKEIRVGGLATVTNDPTGNTLGSSFDGVEAYFEYINTTEKGVYGRKLVLDSKRDDQLGQNKQEAEALVSQDDIFAVLPVAVDLFTGADVLEEAGIPTFGWDINPEWGSEDNKPGPPNFFGQFGSYICFSCAQPSQSLWLAKKLGVKKVGLLALNVPQSKAACQGYEKSFAKYETGAEVVFTDFSLAFGAVDYSAQVAQMVEAGVDYVITCIDGNGVVTLGREMKKQGLDAIQAMPNAYNLSFLEKNADIVNGNYLFTVFTPFETRPKPAGLKLYDKWIKKTGGDKNENSITGWLNADLFVTGLKAAGPDFTQQKLIDAINSLTDYTANGLLAGTDWTKAHEEPNPCYAMLKVVDGKPKPVFGKPGKPFVCLPPTLKKIPANPPVA
jgi:ABC-type branched-subunit amino acid transport system substrate-binding protein